MIQNDNFEAGTLDIKGLMKKVGKGIIVAAASMVASTALGPVAGSAVGSFVAKKMAELGVEIDPDTIGKMIEKKIGDAPKGIAKMFEKKEMSGLAKEIAKELGIKQDEAFAALQYGLRELQNTLSGIIEELQTNQTLLIEVLELARENDVKTDTILDQSSRIETSIIEVDQTLKNIDRQLERIFKEFSKKYSAGRLDYERLLVISRLHRQNALLVSRYGIRYNPDLYVSRKHEESIFEDFVADTAFSDKKIFLVLGDVGMGKTWFLAKLSSITLSRGFPTFFVSLRQGIRSLTGLFDQGTLLGFVNDLETVIAPKDTSAFIFLDGLDEMTGRDARVTLSNLASIQSDAVSFVLSCRIADWTVDDSIAQASHDMRHSIFENQEATHRAAGLGIRTPVSVLLTEFTESETSAAIERYGITNPIPPDFRSLIRRPFILRLVAQWSATHDSIPSPSSPEFLDLMAGSDDPADSILGRLGIITQRETLFEIVRRFILEKRDRLLLSQLSVDPESDAFQTIVSSGILQLSVGRLGTNVMISRDFILPLIALTMERFSLMSDDYNVLQASLQEWLPDIAVGVERLLGQSKSPSIPTRSQGRSKPTDLAQSSTSLPDFTEILGLLSPLLNDEDEDARVGAALGIGLVATTLPDSTEVVHLLRPLLKDEQWKARWGAALGLCMVATTLPNPTERVALLRSLLEDENIRWGVALGIGLVATTLPDSTEVLGLLRLLLKDEDDIIRWNAALGIGMMATTLPNPTERVALLRPLLKDEQWAVRMGAALGIGLVATTLPDSTEVLGLLRPLLKDEYREPYWGAAVGIGLVATTLPDSTEVLGLLRPLLKDEQWTIRRNAALGLSMMATTLPDPTERVALLRPLLKDEQWAVRRNAALGLGLVATTLPDPTEAIALLRPLLKDEDGHARLGAALGLGLVATTLPDPTEAIALLRPLLKDEDGHARLGAALGLGLVAATLPDPTERVALLRPLLKDKAKEVRMGAGIGLGLIRYSVNQVQFEPWLVLESVSQLYFGARLPIAITFHRMQSKHTQSR